MGRRQYRKRALVEDPREGVRQTQRGRLRLPRGGHCCHSVAPAWCKGAECRRRRGTHRNCGRGCHSRAGASVEVISFIGVGLDHASARRAVEHVVANKPPRLKYVLFSLDVDDEEDTEYQKVFALAASAGVSLDYEGEDGQEQPEVVIEEL
ncbi:hypothetical protein DFJ73DRAFT_341134 [Zopfochytrium polystomum]|nr:hypothetical protein DFJ73DRAFT_341134 [Zopfochytrium polystomum]